MKQVYLAGPMRNYVKFNFPAFADATAKLRAKGYKVFSPAEHDLSKGFDPEGSDYPEGRIRHIMLDDLVWICQYADMVVVLPGWEKSKGALAEVHTAWSIGVPVHELEDILQDDFTEVTAYDVYH